MVTSVFAFVEADCLSATCFTVTYGVFAEAAGGNVPMTRAKIKVNRMNRFMNWAPFFVSFSIATR